MHLDCYHRPGRVEAARAAGNPEEAVRAIIRVYHDALFAVRSDSGMTLRPPPLPLPLPLLPLPLKVPFFDFLSNSPDPSALHKVAENITSRAVEAGIAAYSEEEEKNVD